jgi:hypothetical protein
MAIKVVFALLALVSYASACSVPPAGCTKESCAALKTPPGINGKKMGFYFGKFNGALDESTSNKLGGPSVNYEVFEAVGDVVAYGSSKSLSDCCFECAKTAGCVHYQFFDNPTPSKGKKPLPGFYNYVQCYLLKGGPDKKDDPIHGTPFSGRKSDQLARFKSFDASWLGGKCNPDGKVTDDPHFTGAMGTRFDFNGELDKSFCLTADKNLQVNIMLRGYEDAKTTVGATPLAGDDNKALRSWIKEVGLIWKDAAGVSHKVHMVARNGMQQERGDGFMSSLLVDGEKFGIPTVPTETFKGAGGFAIRFVSVEKHGVHDIENFVVTIDGVAVISIAMRVAHATYQTADDAEAHFNIQFDKLVTTPAVHGVLGQTYRNTEAQFKKALQYRELVTLLHGPVVADGESGKGFLEGTVKDYETSSVLSPDCRFSSLSAAQ